MPDSKRDSRRSSRGGPTEAQRHEKREKSRSYQAEARRPSLKPQDAAPTADRPRLKGRTHSAPLVPTRQPQGPVGDSGEHQDSDQDDEPPTPAPAPGASKAPALPGSPRFDNGPQGFPENARYSDSNQGNIQLPVPEINIAVLGASGVGKSTFIQKVLDLPKPSAIGARKLPAEGITCLVRLLEVPFDDFDIDEDDNTISWPDTVEHRKMPRVDGTLTLYDVSDKESFDHVPEVLGAIKKACLPSMLVSTKCDYPPSERQVDPAQIEQKAKALNITTIQTTKTGADDHKRGVSILLRTILSGMQDNTRDATTARRRTISSAIRQASPSSQGHSRSSSEMSGMMRKDLMHARHDSSMASVGGESRLKESMNATEEGMHRSFLNLEESAGEESTASSSDEEDSSDSDGQSETPSDEKGYSFDNLVDRLLALPTSKADNKFAASFLAVYRKFAAPGQLLEAIVGRFEALATSNEAPFTRTSSQLRYLSIIEQWVGAYPGDFAHPQTRRRMRIFVSKLAQTPIFTAAAKEMSADLDAVHEDDDTNWAHSDRDRASTTTAIESEVTWSSRASILLDDPSFDFPDEIGTLTLNNTSSITSNSNTIYTGLAFVESAQRQAQSFVPNPRIPLTKVQWRALMDASDDSIARELTRVDWVMFSSIRPRDLVRHVTLNAEQKAQCKSLVNVERMIAHFNHLGFWVQNFILFRDKPKHRALILEKFMQIARRLRELNNYNTLKAVLAGMESANVHRLNATRELVPPDVVKDWMKLNILMSPSRSHSAYRLAWENSSGERIPFVPLLRRDLVGAIEGNKTFIGDEANGRINWRKFEIEGDVIIGIQRAQGLPYRNSILGARNDDVRSLVLDVKLIKDEDWLYQRSVQVEPLASAGNRSGFRDFFSRR